MKSNFTHIEDGKPSMVDVGEKQITKRVAVAEGYVVLSESIMQQLQENGFSGKKGPIDQTAIVAGIMGAKRTSELIPMCHPLVLDNCKITIEAADNSRLKITCTATCTGKTGVEMEALTGVSVSALTIYDMCKALSHDIEIGPIYLASKSGGKSDFVRS